MLCPISKLSQGRPAGSGKCPGGSRRVWQTEVQNITELMNLVCRKYLTITDLTENIYQQLQINFYIISANRYKDEYLKDYISFLHHFLQISVSRIIIKQFSV